MENRFSRTEMLLGSDAMKKLQNSKIAIFGIGGVGGYVAEALARSGVGHIDIIDNDRVSVSNINRQIIATDKTVGMFKTDAAKERIMQINPDCDVNTFKVFYLPENAKDFDFTVYDYVVDAIDTVSGKIALCINARDAGTPIISSMGTGNKLNPAALEVADIYQTSVCPLARVMRYELKRRGIEHLKVVYSKEIPIKPISSDTSSFKPVPGSNAFVPPAAGLIIASEVIKDLCAIKGR